MGYCDIGIVFLIIIQLTVCTKKPNIVIFLADDLGYGDLQMYGDPVSRTPNIDVMFQDGLKLTQFYSAGTICTPARAGLLTGRYPVRLGFWNNQNVGSIIYLNHLHGLPLNETTIAELVADHGYKSALIGKWHLGVGRNREFLPRHHGFDHFFGIPVPLDECVTTICFAPDIACPYPDDSPTETPCPLFLEDEIIEQPVDLIRLAERQVVAATEWIKEFHEMGSPFMLMYWFVHPHTPHFAGPRFHNSTLGGYYTDSLAELDWQVGQVISTLKQTGQFDDTLFVFTSDNGPAKSQTILGGSSGPLRCGKGSTFEGGTRVPGAVYWPSRIPPGISTEFITHLDIWPTIASIIGSSANNYDIKLDGYDISNVIFNQGKSARSNLMYFDINGDPANGPFAFRYNQYKSHFITLAPSVVSNPNDYDVMCRPDQPFTRHDPPLLYNLYLDAEERVDMADSSGSVLDDLMAARLLEESGLTYGDSVIHDVDDSIEACCNPGCEPFPACCRCVSNYTDALFSISKPTTSNSVSISLIGVVFLGVLLLSLTCAIVCLIILKFRKPHKNDEYVSFKTLR